VIRHFLVLAAGTAAALLATGCGNSAGLVPVSGKVIYKGEAASGAIVYFQRQEDLSPSHELVPFGIVQDDGSFSLSSADLGNGALPGTYKVLIEWRDKTASGVVPVKGTGQTNLVKRSRIHAGPDRLNGRYFDVKKPLLTAEVKPGPNKLEPFELTD
jgi:hypothetical protein